MFRIIFVSLASVTLSACFGNPNIPDNRSFRVIQEWRGQVVNDQTHEVIKGLYVVQVRLDVSKPDHQNSALMVLDKAPQPDLRVSCKLAEFATKEQGRYLFGGMSGYLAMLCVPE
jgi:hypothetical protein